LKKDLVYTFITQFIVLGTGVLVYKLAADLLGKEGFSEYALSRRTVSLIIPALQMGLGMGIPRYIAYANTNPDQKNPEAYFLGGTSTLILVASGFALILNLFNSKFASLFFGSEDYFYLIFPISLVLLGLVLHDSCYSYFRGNLLMFRANFLQLINMGFVPLLAFILGRTTEQILSITGLSWLVVSLVFLFLIIRNLKWGNMNIVASTKELLGYGLQRVPGAFGLAALFTLPATFTAHMAGVVEAGYVAFGITLLNMTGAFFAPIGLILLPKASQIIARKDFKLLNHYILKMFKIVLFITVIGVIFFEVFADKIINLYLGKSFSNIVLVARIIMVGSLPYTVYVSMRSILDAYYVRAVNTANIFAALLLFLLLSGAVALSEIGYVYLVVCSTVAVFLLGVLTMLEIRKIMKQGSHGN